LKSSQRHDVKEKNIFDIEYGTEYSAQNLAETFLSPKELSVGYCNTIACLARTEGLTSISDQNRFLFSPFHENFPEGKYCSMQQYGQMDRQTDVHNNANICS